MLLDLPAERLDFIKNLRKKYKVFLFSNTNEIHLKEFFNIFQQQSGLENLDAYFDKQYYSHVFGRRKPVPDSFIAILNDNKLRADETLFIDDSLRHVQGAKQAGLYAMHLTKEKSFFDVLRFLEEIELEEKNDAMLNDRACCKCVVS